MPFLTSDALHQDPEGLAFLRSVLSKPNAEEPALPLPAAVGTRCAPAADVEPAPAASVPSCAVPAEVEVA
jgi:hypothetical protein